MKGTTKFPKLVTCSQFLLKATYLKHLEVKTFEQCTVDRLSMLRFDV